MVRIDDGMLSSLRKKDIPTPATTWLKPEGTMLSDTSQSPKTDTV